MIKDQTSVLLSILLIQGVFSFLPAWIGVNTVIESIGQSTALLDMSRGFDRTVFMDFIRNYGSLLSSAHQIAILIVLLYLMISIVFNGGLLTNITNRQSGWKAALRSGLRHFVPFLMIALFSWFLVFLFTVVIWLPFFLIIGDPLAYFTSEKTFVWWLVVLLAVELVMIIMIWSWSIMTRKTYLSESRLWYSMKRGFMLLRRNYARYITIGIALLTIHMLLVYGYVYLQKMELNLSWLYVGGMFIIQQFLAYIRLTIRSIAYFLIK